MEHSGARRVGMLSNKKKNMNHGDTSAYPAPAQRIVMNPPPSHSSCRFAQIEAGTPRALASPVVGSLAGDILYGADAIAEFMYGSAEHRRTVYNLIQNKRIPHFRIGAGVCARKSVLMAWIAEQEAAR